MSFRSAARFHRPAESRAASLLCVLILVGCAEARLPRVAGEPPPSFSDPPKEAAYQAVLERYTRHAAIYDNLDTRAFTYVTWQSGPFVSARLERWAVFKDVPSAELATIRAAEEKRLTDVTEFFVAVHVNDSKFDDFERPDSMWRLALAAGGEEHTPLSIERLGRTNTELRSSYSYLESFWVGFRVRFPRVELKSGDVMLFKLASALGKAEFTFTGD